MSSQLRRFVTVTSLALVLALGLAAQGCGGGGGGSSGDNGDNGDNGVPDPTPGTPGDGLVITVRSVSINGGGTVVAEFTMHDGNDIAVGLTDLDSDPQFILAWINTVNQISGFTYTRYQNYHVENVVGQEYEMDGMTQQPALAQATQAGTDDGGSFSMVNPGVYRYTFGTTLPPGYAAAATHTLAGYASRGNRAVVANPIYHFVPNGDDVDETREVATTETCNNCHSELAFHGGTRREVILCQVCHTDQTIDPESGNSVEFQEMIHRIHHGENLTDQPYFVVGFRESVHDYSEIVFPQDTRNCTTCHQGGMDSDNWKLAPSRSACGSCHDRIDWVANAGDTVHSGGPQTDDLGCRQCHQDVSGAEFDRHIPGAHVIPYYSSSNPDLTFAITNATNMSPSSAPTIEFTVMDKGGAVDIAALNRVAVTFAGPTADYTQREGFTIHGGGASGSLMDLGGGAYSYTPAWMLPAGATGTWAVGLEGRTESIMVDTESIRFGGNNPVAYVDTTTGSLGTGSPQVRRGDVVDEALCNTCHGEITFHGNLRTDFAYCVMCHNPWGTDEAQRPGVDPDTNRPESIDFRYMIHKIHRGVDLKKSYTVYGFGGSPHDFTHIVFPGEVAKCSHCHTGDSYELPVPSGLSALVYNVGGVPTMQSDAIRGPAMAACTSCHDSDDAIAHALVNSVINGPYNGDWLEACSVCHGPGSEFDAAKYHKTDD